MTKVYFARRHENFWWVEDELGNNVSDELQRLYGQDVPPEAAGSYILVGIVAAANAAMRVRNRCAEIARAHRHNKWRDPDVAESAKEEIAEAIEEDFCPVSVREKEE